MDVNNTLQPATAGQPSAAADDPALPCGARWRQRDAEAEAEAEADGVGPAKPTALPPNDPDARTAPIAPEPQHALREAELWLLARRAQGAALRLDFELRTGLVRQVFRRDFVFVSRQLHGLEASRRVQGLDRACLNDALAALQQRANEVQGLLDRSAAELQAAIAAHRPADARIAFARPTRFQATIVCPSAHRYLTLLIQADETLARLEMAWLLGLVDPASRTALASDCRRALHGFKDLACSRRQAVGERVREVNARRREATAIARQA